MNKTDATKVLYYNCAPKDGTAGFNVFLVEAIGTAIFISVIMSVVYFNGASGPLNALAIGGTLYGMAKTIGGISGGCLNPAVGLAQTIVQKMAYRNKPEGGRLLDDHTMLLYIIGPFAGGTIAGLYAILNRMAQPPADKVK